MPQNLPNKNSQQDRQDDQTPNHSQPYPDNAVSQKKERAFPPPNHDRVRKKNRRSDGQNHNPQNSSQLKDRDLSKHQSRSNSQGNVPKKKRHDHEEIRSGKNPSKSKEEHSSKHQHNRREGRADKSGKKKAPTPPTTENTLCCFPAKIAPVEKKPRPSQSSKHDSHETVSQSSYSSSKSKENPSKVRDDSKERSHPVPLIEKLNDLEDPKDIGWI